MADDSIIFVINKVILDEESFSLNWSTFQPSSKYILKKMVKLVQICGVFLIVLSLALGERILYSPEITNWGDWGEFENCTGDEYVQGFQLKSEKWIGPLLDDTAMNGLHLFCGEVGNDIKITSSEGSWGQWRNKYTCGTGAFVTGFQLKVEKGSAIDGDETATNNIRILCSNPTSGAENWIEGDGEAWGKWSDERRCGENEAVCGLQTQVQPDRGILLDDTALNNIAVKCCDLKPKCKKSKKIKK